VKKPSDRYPENPSTSNLPSVSRKTPGPGECARTSVNSPTTPQLQPLIGLLTRMAPRLDNRAATSTAVGSRIDAGFFVFLLLILLLLLLSKCLME
jgi:hypothetical protein